MIIERLDFSCALFGPDGGLVSNAPHIPGHLGVMQDVVQYQMMVIQNKEGDYILSKYPWAGGLHPFLSNCDHSCEYDHVICLVM
ncbi:unnamed protein product [Clavelina lepadiformis]|uniref:Hydantoinase B/oxoprolinase domain-containing protein n=1 Tax=Clavelina lepadiformis TaxID=159417 RepID=A0ABP0G6P4_CLALP